MRFALKCLKLPDGLVYFVAGDEPEQFQNADITVLVVADVGVMIQAGEIMLPVLDDVLEHLVKSPNLMISFVEEGRFIEDRASYIAIDREALLEAKGAWGYVKGLLTNNSVATSNNLAV